MKAVSPGDRVWWHHNSLIHFVAVADSPSSLSQKLDRELDMVDVVHLDSSRGNDTACKSDLFASEKEALKAAQKWVRDRARCIAIHLKQAA